MLIGAWRHSGLNSELLNRLARVERQLSSILAGGNTQLKALGLLPEAIGPPPERNRESPQDPEAESECRGSSHLQSPPTTNVQTFSGETSIAHTLSQMEDRLEQMGV